MTAHRETTAWRKIKTAHDVLEATMEVLTTGRTVKLVSWRNILAAEIVADEGKIHLCTTDLRKLARWIKRVIPSDVGLEGNT